MLLNAGTILVEEQQWYYLNYSWWVRKSVYNFLKGISPKVNVIRQLKFELVYLEVTAHDENPYATLKGTSPRVYFVN